MKQKLFTLLTLLCLCVTGAWADNTAGSPATTTHKVGDTEAQVFLDVANTTSNATITEGNIKCLSYGAYYLANSLKPAWMTNNSASKSSTSYTYSTAAAEGFLAVGSSSSVSTGYGFVQPKSGSAVTFYVTGITGVAILGRDNGSEKKVQLSVETIAADGTATSAGAAVRGTDKSNPHVVDFGSALTSSSFYRITIDGTTTDKDYFYQIRFTQGSAAPDETAPTFSLTTPATISNVAVTSHNVVLTASEAVTKVGDNVTGTLKIGSAAASAINYTFNAEAKTLTYTFDADLAYETNYAFTVDANQVQDAAGNKNAETSAFSFTTMGEPVSCTITFDKGEGVTGVAPDEVTKENGTVIKLPKNFTMYKEGYTMTGWDEDGDGTADYAPDANYTVTGTKTLTAVFTSNNGVTLADRNTATTVKFEFQRGEGAPTIAWGEGSGAHLWVGQASVNGNIIDVKADINVTASGKMANGSWTDWIQINNTTEFTLPSAENAVVNVRVYNSDDASTVNGNARNSIASSVATYNVSSTNSTALFVASGPYYKYIEVILPPTLTAESDRTWDFTSATEFTDAASADKTYSAETRVNNLLIGNGAQLMKSDQRLKLNNQGTSSQYYVKIKAAAHSKITVSAVGGSNRNVTFAENAVGGKVLGTVDCANNSAQDKVLMDTGDGDKIICIYNSNSGNITLYRITVEEYTASAPTAVTVTPSPAAAYKDASITLTATADGAPTPTITWYQCDDAEKTNPVSKGTGTTYNPATNVAGTFYFYAEAENASGSAASAVVTLTVTDPNKYNVGNAYYFTNGEAAVNGEKIYGDDITVELTGANGGLNDAAAEGSVATLDANYVAVVTGKDGGNGWGPTFTPAVDGTVTLGAFFNGNNSRKVKITNVTSFIYQNNGDEEATVNNSDEYIPSAAFRGLVTFDVEAGTTYVVSFSGSKMGFYGFEFTPEKVAVTKRNDRTYGTFVATKALDFTGVTDMEAYIAKGLNGTSVSIEKVTKVPANTPIIVKTAEKTTASVNVPVTSNATAADVEGNLLVAGDGITEWNGTAGYTYYYLASDQFHKGTSGTLQTGKAYLKVEGDPTSAKAMIINIGEGEATGINAIEEVTPVTKTRKVVKNGRLVIETANGVFTIDGARVK